MANNNNRRKIDINILNFEGDPSLINFFFDQLKSYANLNKLKPEETVAFLKGKLAGPALKFLTQSPELYKSNDFEFIEKEFKSFFAPMSKTQALLEFNNIQMLPQETIKNIAHRINNVTLMVYPQINEEALNEIKFMKFLSVIPSSIRIKIQEENITDYRIAITRAQALQDIFSNEKILQSHSSDFQSDTISKKLNEISENLLALTISKPKRNSKSPSPKKSPRNKSWQPRYKSRYTFKNVHKNANNRNEQSKQKFRNNPSPPVCQLCFKRYHTAQRCFKWKNANKNNGQSNNFNQFRNISSQSEQLN